MLASFCPLLTRSVRKRLSRLQSCVLRSSGCTERFVFFWLYRTSCVLMAVQNVLCSSGCTERLAFFWLYRTSYWQSVGTCCLLLQDCCHCHSQTTTMSGFVSLSVRYWLWLSVCQSVCLSLSLPLPHVVCFLLSCCSSVSFPYVQLWTIRAVHQWQCHFSLSLPHEAPGHAVLTFHEWLSLHKELSWAPNLPQVWEWGSWNGYPGGTSVTMQGYCSGAEYLCTWRRTKMYFIIAWQIGYIGYVSVSQWVSGGRGIGMWRKLKCVTTTLSSGRKPAVTSIYYRVRKRVEVYLHCHTTRL